MVEAVGAAVAGVAELDVELPLTARKPALRPASMAELAVAAERGGGGGGGGRGGGTSNVINGQPGEAYRFNWNTPLLCRRTIRARSGSAATGYSSL